MYEGKDIFIPWKYKITRIKDNKRFICTVPDCPYKRIFKKKIDIYQHLYTKHMGMSYSCRDRFIIKSINDIEYLTKIGEDGCDETFDTKAKRDNHVDAHHLYAIPM